MIRKPVDSTAHFVSGVCLFLCLAWITSVSAAHSQSLTPAQLRGAAIVALEEGQPALTLEAADALLVRDAEDLIALLLKARAARDLGHFDIAQQAASQAWSLSKTKGQRFDSARVMAQILSSQDKRTRSQLWLRRAVENAPDEWARQLAINDFRYVSARNRWNTRLNFSVSPNSNINNGSVSENTQILNFFSQDYVTATLGGAARALSGLEASAGVSLRYRLLETSMYRTDFLLQGDMRRYVLSDAAKEIAPTVSASDFALDSLNAGILHKWRDAKAPVEYQFAALVGATRYGGEHYSDSLRLNFGVHRVLDPGTRIGLALGGDLTRGPVAPHADTMRLGVNLESRQASGALWAAGLTFADSNSDSNAADYREVRLDLTSQPNWTLLGAQTEFGVRLRARNYDTYTLFSPDGRRDREVAAFVTFNFTASEYYGYIPSLTVEASRTASSIGLFEVDRLGLQLGIKSAF